MPEDVQLTGEKACLAYNCRSFHQWLAVFSCCWACWGKKSWWKGIEKKMFLMLGRKQKEKRQGGRSWEQHRPQWPTSSEDSQWNLPPSQKPVRPCTHPWGLDPVPCQKPAAEYCCIWNQPLTHVVMLKKTLCLGGHFMSKPQWRS